MESEYDGFVYYLFDEDSEISVGSPIYIISEDLLPNAKLEKLINELVPNELVLQVL